MRYILAILLFMLVIFIGLFLLFGHGKKSPSAAKTAKIMTLTDYSDTNATVSVTTEGIVNGQEEHRAVRVTVGRDFRTLDIMSGYSGSVIDSHTYSNSADAYYVFLKAIDLSGFLNKMKNSKVNNDPRGYCALGSQTSFKLQQGDKTISSLWTSTCGIGNFGGNPDNVITLFHNQIPDYGNLTAETGL